MSKLKKIIFLLLLFFIAPSFVFCQTQDHDNDLNLEKIFNGNLSFDRLTASVSQSTLLKEAPHPQVNQLMLHSVSEQNKQPYSTYLIQPLLTIGSRSYYQTTETVKDGSGFKGIPKGASAIVRGQGISFGGIFWPIEKMEVKNRKGKTIYLNKIIITEIEKVSGHIFPMKVGRELSFHFKRIHERFMNGQTTQTTEDGIMTYKIIRAQDHYQTLAGKTVPGQIYTLTVSESTNLHPKTYLTDEYDYAPALGWYINDHYYNLESQPIAQYHLYDWK